MDHLGRWQCTHVRVKSSRMVSSWVKGLPQWGHGKPESDMEAQMVVPVNRANAARIGLAECRVLAGRKLKPSSISPPRATHTRRMRRCR